MRYRQTGALNVLGVVTLVFCLVGCTTTRLDSKPQPAVDLSGHWILDTLASDDASALIRKALPVQRPIRPSTATNESLLTAAPSARQQGGGRRSSRGGGDADGMQTVAMDNQPTAWGKVRPYDFVSAFAAPPSRVDLAQAPTQLQLTGDARRREFTPGDEAPFSVTDRFGSRKVRAGWQGHTFVILSQDGSRLDVTERYGRLIDDRLESHVTFKAQNIKTLSIHAVYRRATPAEWTISVEGPPPPVPH
jgi:hypothetical protein